MGPVQSAVDAAFAGSVDLGPESVDDFAPESDVDPAFDVEPDPFVESDDGVDDVDFFALPESFT